jgi:hypothetical protein
MRFFINALTVAALFAIIGVGMVAVSKPDMFWGWLR